MNTHFDTIIIGAGISGLTLAYNLQKAGQSVCIIEKSSRSGGAIKTIRHNGWVLETGPNTILVTNTWFSDLIKELGLNAEILVASKHAKNRYIVKNGNTVALPLSPIAFFKSPLFSLKTKIRLLKEPFIAPMQSEDETLADFVNRRLGKEFLDYAINPFVAGVYAGKPTNLSVKYGFPKLYDLERKHGSLIKGAFKGPGKDRNPRDIPRNKAEMISFKKGNEQLIDALTKSLGPDGIKYDESIHSIHKENSNSYSVTTNSNGVFKCKNIVLTIPTHALENIKFIGFKNADTFPKSVQLTYPPVHVVHLGFNKSNLEHPLDGFGMLVPEVESHFILGALFNSTLFPHRTPSEDHALITVFTGGSRHPEVLNLSDDELIERVHYDIKSILGYSKKPDFSYITKWTKAIPQYDMMYGNKLDIFELLECSNNGLYFCGNFKNGISVGDCIKSASELAQRLLVQRE